MNRICGLSGKNEVGVPDGREEMSLCFFFLGLRAGDERRKFEGKLAASGVQNQMTIAR